ncbi:MAG: S41 family peptidase [bacterium]|nr:S41 family peptidase [bacterium]
MENQTFFNKKTILAIVLSAVLLFTVFFAGIFVGFERRPAIEKITSLTSKETAKPATVDFSIFWETWATLLDRYVDKNKIDSQKEVYGAISGMVKSVGDPYTVFFSPEENKQFHQDLKGEFGGIGAELGIRKGALTVIAPLKDSPAEHAGIRAGDRIVKIDDTPTDDFTLERAVQKIRGERKTPVKLAIMRDSFASIKDFTIIRDTIVVPVISTKQEPDSIFYIHLLSFSESSPKAFRGAVKEFTDSGSKKLVLDLRGNPGGFLNAAVDIGSWFLLAGEIVSREHFADGNEDLYRSNGYELLEATPTIVLIDQGSASASEILAGALRDVRKIKLIGQKSFGKGSVQELVNLTGGASLKVTIAKWLTPSGKTIEGEGLEPDEKIEITQKDIDTGNDPQLNRALEILKTL